MVEEVIPRLRTLKRQTNKWEKRAAVQKELNDFENEYFSRKLNEIKNSRKEFEPLLDSLENQIKRKEEELKILELEIKKLNLSQKRNIKKLKNKNQQSKFLLERSQIQKELGRLEAKLEFLAVSQRMTVEFLKTRTYSVLLMKPKSRLKNA